MSNLCTLEPNSPSALWGTAQPWFCVATQTGGATNQVPKGLNERILGAPKPSSCTSPNHWPNYPPGDPRVRNTIRVIDGLLETETKTGPVWRRYDQDGYGEHEDGRSFDGTGVGRGWPLLAGERAHYELMAGNREEAERLLKVIEAQTSFGGLIPEQVWDGPDLPERELFNGKPSGSAMPLVWAHAERA